MGSRRQASRCDAVYVELGEYPDLDRLLRCDRSDCPDHPVQLNWIRADPERLAAYNEQLRRYDLGLRASESATQEALL